MHRVRPTDATDNLTAVVVNFRTLDAMRTCLTTLRAAYPTLRTIVVDNGSADESTAYLRELDAAHELVQVIFNDENLFHGPALDLGVRAARTDFVFLLDSDCEILHGGFLEPLVEAFAEDPLLYAIGKRGYANRYGYGPISERERWTYYVHPFAAVIDRRKYLALPPFVHHGAPAYRNMWGATKAGYHLRHVTIEDHVAHRRRTTAGVHGYGYDLRLRLQASANDLDHRIRSLVARVTGRELRPPELPPARTGEGPELREYELERLRAPAETRTPT
jgi:glycosyltransferase involved in cell wall biosynthesis